MQIRLGALAAAVALALAAAGCGGGGGGEKGGSIKIGGIFDLSGATADVGTPYAQGVRAKVRNLNSNGGIDGRKINLISEDYAYDVARAEQLYSRLKAERVVAVQGWGTGDTEALRSRVTTDKLPFMSASYAAPLTNPKDTPFNFVVATSYSDQMRIALKWISQQAKGRRAEVAVFHHDSPFGESPLEDGKKYIEQKGLKLGYKAYAMPTGATDFVSELSRAKSQGASYIVIQNVSSPAAQLAKDVKRTGLHATIVCLNWCGDELFIDLAKDAAEGVVAVMPFAPAGAKAPGLKPPAASAGGRLEDKGVHYVQGWYTMDVMAQGLRRVLQEGDEVSGESLRKSLEQMPAFKTGDVTAPIDFTADSHEGMTSSRLYRVKDGKWVELTGFLTP